MFSIWVELRKVPMLFLALPVAAGIVLALNTNLDSISILWVCLALGSVTAVLLVAGRWAGLGALGLLLFFMAFGAYRATVFIDRPNRRAVAALGEARDSVTVIGRVSLPASDSPRQNCVVLERCTIYGRTQTVAAGDSKVRVYTAGTSVSALRYGDRACFVGYLSARKEMYNTRAVLINSLIRREIGTVYADSSQIGVVASTRKSLRRSVDGFRAYARHVFSSLLGPDAAALSKALLLGDRGEFGQEFAGNLRITGLSHIFALSGMNTGLVVLMVWIGISWLPIPHSLRLWVLLAALLLYMEIGRETPSLVRASLAASCMIAGNLLHRRAVFMNLILAAMFIELLWKPLDLIDAGFLLSYLAVFGIVGSYAWLRRRLLKWWTRPRSLIKGAANVVAGTISAQIGTAPVVGYLFHRVPFLGALGNLLVVPGFAFLLVLAILLLVLYPIGHWIVQPVASAVDGVAWTLASVVSLCAVLPLASFAIAPFALGSLVAICASIGIILLGLAARRGAWVAFGLLVVANFAVWSGSFGKHQPTCEVTFIDVENGDATLVSAGGHNVLIDAGPAYGSWSASRRILSVLAEQRVDHLDALILTHPDNDHIGGAAELLLEVPVTRIFTNTEHADSYTALQVELAAAHQGKRSEVLASGDILRLASDVLLSVLSPDSARLSDGVADNEKSLTMRLDAGQSSMFLPADIDGSVESELASWGERMDVDLIKSPHHGAKRSTSEDLLALTTPNLCVISSGRRNPFGHPAPEVLSRLAGHHVEVHNTATDGTMLFVANQGGWKRSQSNVEVLASRWKLLG